MKKTWVAVMVLLCISCAGVNYAYWTDSILISTSVATGELHMGFEQKAENYRLIVVQSDGTMQEYTAKQVEENEEGAAFYLDKEQTTELLAKLAASTEVKLCYPLEEKENNTIEEMDFAAASPELVFTCKRAAFVADGQTQELSEEQRRMYAPELKFSERASISQDETTGLVTQTYGLTDESRTALVQSLERGVPEEQKEMADTGASIVLEAEYQMSLTLNIQQKEAA